MDLEHELRALPVAWPQTPAFSYARRRARRPLAVAVAAAVLAAAFAVPQSRGAILRFLHLGGVEIRFVDTLPPAQERPLASGLGSVVTLAQAHRILGPGTLLLPPLDQRPPLHFANGILSLVFAYRGHEVLLSEIGFGGPVALQKAVGGLTHVEHVTVGGNPGIWVSGSQHVYIFPAAAPRLAGNVLIWTAHDTTYRIEGKGLTKPDALALAVRMR
jgi:hypothetical protein